MCVLYIVHTIAQGAKNGKIIQYQFNKYIILMKHVSGNQWCCIYYFLHFFSPDLLLWIDVNVEVEKGKRLKKRAALFFLPLLRSMLRTIRDPDFFGSIWLLALWFSRIYYNLH